MGGYGDLSLKQAQRIAVAAQRLTGPRSDGASPRHSLQGVYQVIGQTQIDSVNVVCRAHYQPLFARLGNYRTQALDALVATPHGGVSEYWGHEASYVRSELIGDLLRFRSGHWADRSAHFTASQRRLQEDVLQYLQQHPGSSAREISAALQVPANRDGTHWGWNWNDTKLVTEALFRQARILSLGRNRQFERRFALAHHVLSPGHLHPAHDAHESLARLVLAAIASLGIASESSLAEYYRLPRRQVSQSTRRLIEEGRLQQVRVQGQRDPMLMPAKTTIPVRVGRSVRILSPFDSMVFDRARLHELFGFHYRIEIYVPAAKRQYGYYVFPILWGHRFVGRTDLKADRAASALRVNLIHFEADPEPELLERVNDELWRMARWLGLERVTIAAEHSLCTPWALAAKRHIRP